MPNWIFYVTAFLIYSGLILLFGYHGLEKTRNSVDFYLANRSLKLIPAVCTFTATWFSAASMQGFTGSVYTYGISTVIYSVLAWFGGLSIMLLLTNRLRENKIVTIPEFFSQRYKSKLLQVITALVLLGCYLYYIALQIRGVGIIIGNFLDVPYTLAILFTYVFILYTTFGGMYSVARTDSLHTVLLIIGTVGMAALVLVRVGGWQELLRQIPNISGSPLPNFRETSPGALLDPYSNGQFNLLFYISTFFGWGLGLAANPQYYVRLLAARDNRTATRTIYISAIILLIMYLACLVTGLGSRVLMPSAPVSGPDAVLPYFANTYMSSFFGCVVLISLIAAAVSTANSQLLLIASSSVYDLYRNMFNTNADEDRLLSLNRLAIVLGGSLSFILAISPPAQLLIFGSYIWGIVAASIFMPLLGGLLFKRIGLLPAFISCVGGLLTTIVLLIWHTSKPVTQNIHPAMPGVIVSAALYLGFGYYEKVKGKRP